MPMLSVLLFWSRRHCVIWFAWLMLALTSFPPKAAGGGWAEDFVLPGANGTVRALAEDAQAWYIVGDFTAVGSVVANHVARVDKMTGAVSALGSGITVGGAVVNMVVSSAAFFQGELWVGGQFDNAGGVGGTSSLARWDGSNWKSTGAGLSPFDNVQTLVADGGALYIGGDFSKVAGLPDTQARAVWDGSAWQKLGNGLTGKVYAIAHTNTGTYLGGAFFLSGTSGQVYLAKWTGGAWTEVLTELDDLTPVHAIAVMGTDVMLGLELPVLSNVERWNGVSLSAVGTTFREGKVNALAVAGSTLYAGGEAGQSRNDLAEPDTVRNVSMAKYSGADWTEPGQGVQGTVHGLLASGGSVYAVGEFTQAGGLPCVRMAKWNGTQWSAVVQAGSGNGVGNRVLAILDAGKVVYIGGDFTVAGGVVANRIACWNKATRKWSPLGSGMRGSYMDMHDPSTVEALAMVSGVLYAGGNFRFAGAADCDNIARWNGTSWSNMGSGTSGSGHVKAMLARGPDLYVAGGFDNMDGADNTAQVARWDGSRWWGLGTEFSKFTYVRAEIQALCFYGSDVIAAGSGYQGADGATHSQLYRWNGTEWSQIFQNGNPISGVQCLAEYAGKLYVGKAGTLAAWNGTDFSAARSSFNWQNARMALVVAGGNLYAASTSATVTLEETLLSRFDGTVWSDLLDNESPSLIHALAADEDGNLYAGGVFTEMGGQLSHNFALFRAGGTPVMGIEGASHAELLSGNTLDFGSMAVTQISAQLSLTIKNTGTGTLYGQIDVEEAAAQGFQITQQAQFPLAAGASTTLGLAFAPIRTGIHNGTLHILSNDGAHSPFDLLLTGTGIAFAPPSVKTLAADNVTAAGAVLHGTVDGKGSSREVVFEYGETAAYGSVQAASPATITEAGVKPVSLALNGLKAHTKYHFRVKASSIEGSATGSNLTFTTLNTLPIAREDTYEVAPGVTSTLAVLTNDFDADGDAINVTSYTAVNPRAAGTLSKSGNTFSFKAAAGFLGSATFNYTVSDGFGGTASATVTLNHFICTIDPVAKEVPSAGVTYPITVTAAAQWPVTESLNWATVSPASGRGDGIAQVTLLPNAAKSSRSGSITIGGVVHTITQAGVIAPELTPPAAIPPAIVSGFFELPIVTAHFPVTYAVSQLPPGLKIDSTGLISGTPTKSGRYNVVVKASNAAGTAALPAFEIVVDPLKPGVVGNFHGFIPRDSVLNGNLGSRLELTTSLTGSCTGKIISGVTAQVLKGQLRADPLLPNIPRLVILIPRRGATDLILDVTLNAVDNNLDGTLSDGGAHTVHTSAWRNPWSTTRKATAFFALHTFSLEPDAAHTEAPQGFGYGAFAPKESTGAVTVMGKLADGSPFATATFVGAGGQVLIYQPLYANKGSLAGVISVTMGGNAIENTVGVAEGEVLDWLKPGPMPNSKDTIYKSGFGPAHLTVEGAAYTPPAKGAIVMELPAPASNDNAKLEFESGGLPAKLEITFGILNPSATGLTNKVIMPAFASGGNPQKINLPTLTPATGSFGGDFTLVGETAAKNRKVTFQGQMVRHISGGIRGYGFFLMPELPDNTGETLANTPKHSGRVILRAAP